MGIVQADSCLNSEQIDAVLLVWGVRKGVGEGGHFGLEAHIYTLSQN